MTAGDWLSQATKKLAQAGIATARLDALVLLEDITGRGRAWTLAHPEMKIDAKQVARLQKLLDRRSEHEPLAYLRKKTEFYGREFIITHDVLEPRPESETVIDLLKTLPGLPAQPSIADVGTGSGALGITAALELPAAHVDLIEIDPKALKVAKMNVDKFTLSLKLILSDLLLTTRDNYNVLLCNLPYVPDSFQINTAATREPRLAIFGGTDGLQVYRRLFNQLKNRRFKPLYILSESLPPQHEALTQIARQSGYDQFQKEDFVVVFKQNN